MSTRNVQKTPHFLKLVADLYTKSIIRYNRNCLSTLKKTQKTNKTIKTISHNNHSILNLTTN